MLFDEGWTVTFQLSFSMASSHGLPLYGRRQRCFIEWAFHVPLTDENVGLSAECFCRCGLSIIDSLLSVSVLCCARAKLPVA